MKALILCAGDGVRLGLKETPKCMAKVNGKPILEHLVNQLNQAGITEIIVNVHRHYEKIFNYFGTRLLYFYEPTLLGEAGTERHLQNWMGDEYIVMNGDTLTNVNIYDMMNKTINGNTTLFSDGYTYKGIKYINRTLPGTLVCWDGGLGSYYFDCGTPKRLARARRFYKQFK